jgi:hypothetical protein
MNIITSVMIFNPDSFEEESFKQFILDNFKVGLSSYLLLKLKFKDNRMDTSVYKLAEFNRSDIQYIEGVFIWLNAKVFSFNWDEQHNL